MTSILIEIINKKHWMCKKRQAKGRIRSGDLLMCNHFCIVNTLKVSLNNQWTIEYCIIHLLLQHPYQSLHIHFQRWPLLMEKRNNAFIIYHNYYQERKIEVNVQHMWIKYTHIILINLKYLAPQDSPTFWKDQRWIFRLYYTLTRMYEMRREL